MNHLLDKIRRARLRVKPAIEIDELQRFEAKAGVVIPSDYRDFLLTCCNGGIEPCRFVPLKRWDACYWTEVDPERASWPCLVTPDAEQHGDKWLDQLGVPDWESKWDSGLWDPMFGTIAVAEIGCGLFFSLIMNGDYRGRVFSWGDHALNPPLFVEHDDFTTWIESCLDASIAGQPIHFLDGRIR